MAWTEKFVQFEYMVEMTPCSHPHSPTMSTYLELLLMFAMTEHLSGSFQVDTGANMSTGSRGISWCGEEVVLRHVEDKGVSIANCFIDS